MEKIASFQVDHLKLLRGIYVSRVDQFGDTTLTTFDIRMTQPNFEPVIDVPALHTLEHMGATFMRSHEQWKSKTVYFGPMGCRTGIYLLVEGKYTSAEILPVVKEFFEWTLRYEGEVPGAKAEECGNWRDHNLDMAKWEARKFYEEVLQKIRPENLDYPR